MARARIVEENLAIGNRGAKSFFRLLSWTTAIMAAWITASVLVFCAPVTGARKHADVLLVLAPSAERLDVAEQLMDQEYAGTLAISVPGYGAGESGPALCTEKRTYKVVCFSPEPVTTRGEGRALERLSGKYGWKSANVLTAQFHVFRARTIIARCYKGELFMIAYKPAMPFLSVQNPRNSWLYHFAYETAAFAKVLFSRDC